MHCLASRDADAYHNHQRHECKRHEGAKQQAICFQCSAIAPSVQLIGGNNPVYQQGKRRNESQQSQCDDDLESRVLRLEEENRSLGRQVSELKSEISDLRGDLGLIMRRLGIDD